MLFSADDMTEKLDLDPQEIGVHRSARLSVAPMMDTADALVFVLFSNN